MIINFFRNLFRRKKEEEEEPPVIATGETNADSDTVNDTNMDNSKKPINGNDEGRTPNEFLYLYKLIRYRVSESFRNGHDTEKTYNKPDFSLSKPWQGPFADFVDRYQLNEDEVVLLLIGMAPYVHPHLFANAIRKELPQGMELRDYQYMGGARGHNSGFFLPTGETAIFLIAGEDSARRIRIQELFGAEHLFWEKKIIWLEDMQEMDPPMNGKIIMSRDYFDLLTTGTHKSPQFSISFPAKKSHRVLKLKKNQWRQ